MATITLPTQGLSIIILGRAITDLVQGDVVTITPVSPVTEHINSANGGVTITKRVDGDVHDVMIPVQKGSASDAYLNSLANTGDATVIDGTIKQNYLRDGVALVESWACQNGSMTTRPTSTSNNETGNAQRDYTIRFRSAVCSL